MKKEDKDQNKRVERHLIKYNDSNWKLIDELCFKSKNIYNCANYIVRQEFIFNKGWICYNELDKLMQKYDCYYELGSTCSQQTLRVLDSEWNSYFKAIKKWYKNPEEFSGKPRIPRYKDKEKGRKELVLTNQQCKIVDGYLFFSFKPLKSLNNKYKVNPKGKLMQTRFVPEGGNYVLEVVYEIKLPEFKKENKRIVGIDIGINNLATVVNNIGLQPFVINGRPLKSINQYYNKQKAKLQSDLKLKHDKNWSKKLQALTNKRNNKIEDYIHKASKMIVDWCVENNIDTVVVGKNKNWKQESDMGKINNQNFVSMPHDKFIQKIKYKCADVGINFIENEESYTSGTSFLDGEEPIKENYNIKRRFKQTPLGIQTGIGGLFKSNRGELINADVNGAYQIIKKVFPDAFVDGIEDVGLHPVRLNVA